MNLPGHSLQTHTHKPRKPDHLEAIFCEEESGIHSQQGLNSVSLSQKHSLHNTSLMGTEVSTNVLAKVAYHDKHDDLLHRENEFFVFVKDNNIPYESGAKSVSFQRHTDQGLIRSNQNDIK